MKKVFLIIAIIGCFSASYLISAQQEEGGVQQKVELTAIIPTNEVELLVQHEGHLVSYNINHNTPNWVAWTLTANHTDGEVQRSSKFYADPAIPTEYRVDWFEYKESGYDRGHMCPAADNKYDSQAMHDCFYMSNMCPQNPNLNSGDWKKLENACRTWAEQEGEIYIISGPVYTKGKHEKIGIDHAIDVPEGFYKVVYSLRPGYEKAIGFHFENNSQKQRMQSVAITVQAIEQLTGIDFFPALANDLETRIEGTLDKSAWF